MTIDDYGHLWFSCDQVHQHKLHFEWRGSNAEQKFWGRIAFSEHYDLHDKQAHHAGVSCKKTHPRQWHDEWLSSDEFVQLWENASKADKFCQHENRSCGQVHSANKRWDGGGDLGKMSERATGEIFPSDMSHEDWVRLKPEGRSTSYFGMFTAGVLWRLEAQEEARFAARFERPEIDWEYSEKELRELKKERSEASWAKMTNVLMIAAILLFVGWCLVNDRGSSLCPDDPGECYDYQIGRE